MSDYIGSYDYKIESEDNKTTRLQTGLKIASVNVRGLVTHHNQRLDLYLWMIDNDIDVVCVQEWCVNHRRENIKFDKTLYDGYDTVEIGSNSKTLIIYKSKFRVDKLSKLNCDDDGLDETWMALFSNEYIVAIGSVYHSPSYEHSYDVISNHMKIIRELYKDRKEKLVFSVNGDFNSKNCIWGSSKTDKRGQYCADWIGANDLEFITDGSPTYINRRKNKEDVLDLQMISEFFFFL